MLHYGAAIAFVILAWWLSTGTILYAAGRESPKVVPLMAVATAMAIAGFAALWISTAMRDVAGVYLGFLGALAIWGWHEASFLAGIVTGPRRIACRPGSSGFERFRDAFLAVRDHELAIAATGMLVIAVSIGAENRIGMWTFLLLWVMRITAKLVLFLGAPHVAVAMLPPRLAYLSSYFRTDRTSAAFPVFLAAMVVLFVLLCAEAATAANLHDAISATVLATFLGLAIAEHLLLVLPVSDAALWRWAMPEGQGASAPQRRTVQSDRKPAFNGNGASAIAHAHSIGPVAQVAAGRRHKNLRAARVQSGGRK